MALLDKLKVIIFGRQYAYKRTFDGPLANEVLSDLAWFCRAHASTFHENPHIASKLDGRREVLLRIQQHLKLSADDLFEISTGQRRHDQIRLNTKTGETDNEW